MLYRITAAGLFFVALFGLAMPQPENVHTAPSYVDSMGASLTGQGDWLAEDDPGWACTVRGMWNPNDC